MARITYKNFSGMVTEGDRKDIPKDSCYEQKNMFCFPGLFQTREGTTKLKSTYWDGGGKTNLISNELIGVGTKLYNTSGVEKATGYQDEPIQLVYFNGRHYGFNGQDINFCWDGVSITNMGIAAPSAAATDEGTNLTGSLTVGGVYKIKYEYYNTNKQRPPI